MTNNQAVELLRQLTAQYFAGATVIHSKQSRTAKPDIPLVVIDSINTHRARSPVTHVLDGQTVGEYEACSSITVDLFTNGGEVVYDDKVVARENTALDDITGYEDFLDSQFVKEWSHRNDITITIDTDPQDLSSVVNDTTYAFRSRINLRLYFTHRTAGHANVFTEASIGETTVTPEFEQSPSGGGSEELAALSTGHFTNVEIENKEE